MSEEVNRGSLWRGLGLGVAINIGAAIAGVVLIMAVVGFAILLGIGLVQLCWMVPLYLKYQRQGETETAKGLAIAAGLTFLLNAGCWGFVAAVGLNIGR